MTRTYDKPRRPVAGPADIARDRASRFPDPLDQNHFLSAFAQGRVAEARGDERRYVWYREALEADDSVRVAGLIEGMASVPQSERKRLPWKM